MFKRGGMALTPRSLVLSICTYTILGLACPWQVIVMVFNLFLSSSPLSQNVSVELSVEIVILVSF